MGRIPGVTSIIFMVFMAVPAWSTDKVDASIAWETWSPQVLERAQRGGRLVLVDLTAEWCRFCKKMDATTYRDPQVVGLINRDFIAVRLDEKEQSGLMQRYRQLGFPGTVILDSEGAELVAKVGYLKPQWMLWLLQAVVRNPVAEAHAN